MDLKNDNELEIDLLELLMVLIGRWWLIVLVGITTAVCGFAISFFLITPTYESTTKIYILNKSESQTVTYSDVQLGSQLTKDYSALITSRYVLEDVIQKLNLNMEYKGLKGKIEVATPSDTRILSITVSDKDPVVAMNIANAVRESASVHISNVMDIDAVNIVESANMPTEKSAPSYTKAILIGGFAGIFLVCAVLLIGYLLDDTIKVSEDAEKYLGLSTLGTIPYIAEGDTSKGKKKKRR